MNHIIAETLAMKALIMNSQKKKTEAFTYIKQALFKNLSNFTCWHVYGILHKSNKYDSKIIKACFCLHYICRNTDEARKAYLNALKYDAEN